MDIVFGDIEVVDYLDSDGDMSFEMVDGERYGYLRKEDAIALVKHLQTVFQLEATDKVVDVVQSMGFENEEEFHRMVVSVDLPKYLVAFKRWQHDDGTKAGLVNVIAGRAHDLDGGL